MTRNELERATASAIATSFYLKRAVAASIMKIVISCTASIGTILHSYLPSSLLDGDQALELAPSRANLSRNFICDL